MAWRYNAASNCFEPAASLQGHTLAVVTLYVGANRLYSGSMDKSIKVNTWIVYHMLELKTSLFFGLAELIFLVYMFFLLNRFGAWIICSVYKHSPIIHRL